MVERLPFVFLPRLKVRSAKITQISGWHIRYASCHAWHHLSTICFQHTLRWIQPKRYSPRVQILASVRKRTLKTPLAIYPSKVHTRIRIPCQKRLDFWPGNSTYEIRFYIHMKSKYHNQWFSPHWRLRLKNCRGKGNCRGISIRTSWRLLEHISVCVTLR